MLVASSMVVHAVSILFFIALPHAKSSKTLEALNEAAAKEMRFDQFLQLRELSSQKVAFKVVGSPIKLSTILAVGDCNCFMLH